jgi:uncharacterized protein (TIGR03437 family)
MPSLTFARRVILPIFFAPPSALNVLIPSSPVRLPLIPAKVNRQHQRSYSSPSHLLWIPPAIYILPIPAITESAKSELISIFGTRLGPQTPVNAQADSNGFIETQLAGTQVFMQGVAAPVLYTSDGRVNAVVPFSLYGYPELLVQVAYNNVLSDAIVIQMWPVAPIVFTSSTSGQPVPIVVNQDGSINSPSNPAAPLSAITFYGSGFGLTTPTGTDGHIAAAPLPKPALPVTAGFGGEPVNVLYAGDVLGMVEGVVQVNLLVPKDAYTGDLSVIVGGVEMDFTIYVGGTQTTTAR